MRWYLLQNLFVSAWFDGRNSKYPCGSRFGRGTFAPPHLLH
jgi:hypothetical protein